MEIEYKDLNQAVRDKMLAELHLDEEQSSIYISKRIVSGKDSDWIGLLKEAICFHNDDWLA